MWSLPKALGPSEGVATMELSSVRTGHLSCARPAIVSSQSQAVCTAFRLAIPSNHVHGFRNGGALSTGAAKGKLRSGVVPGRNFFLGKALQGKVSNGCRWSAATWLEQSAQVETEVPLQVAWDLWEDRELVTRWMPWISSVEVQKDKPELSKWTLKYEAFGQKLQVSWMARNLQPIYHQKIHWRSVDGHPNRGAVRFFPRGPSACAVQLSVSYEVPEQLAGVVMAVSPLVESILKADLERFAAFAKDNRVQAKAN